MSNLKRNKGIYPLLASNGISDNVDIYNAENVVAFGCRGTIGNVFYQQGKCFVLNTAFYLTDNKRYGNLFYALIYENGLTSYHSGAAQPQITLDAIKDVVLLLPNDNDLNKYLDLMSTYDSIINKLKSIKLALLNKYF